MASEEKATLKVIIKKVGDAAFSGVRKGLKGIQSAVGVAAGSLKLVGSALAAVGAVAIKTVKDFGEFQGVRKSFRALAQSQGQDAKAMLASMKELSAGTISSVELMKQANNAMLLGLPIDRMGDMLKIARSSAQATGESMQKMFADLTTGLGRGSKLVLDNLGITFKLNDAYDEYAAKLGKTASKLTEAEKKQAFINKALEIGVSNASKSGETNLTLAESLSRVTAGLKDFSIFVGQAAAPAVQFFAEQLGQFFQDSNNQVASSALQEFFRNTARIVTIAKGVFLTFGQAVGTTIAAVSESASALFQGRFSKAIEMAKLGFQTVKDDAVNQAIATGEELNRIDELYAQQRAQKAVENEIMKNEMLKEVKAENAEELTAEKEAKIEAETLEAQREMELVGKTELEKQKIRLKFMKDDIKNFKGHAKQKKLLETKLALEEKKHKQALVDFDDEENKRKERNTKSTLAIISNLSQSQNKTAAAIGKAAAITQIAIQTPVAVGNAIASNIPYPGNFIAAGVVAAAMAVQAAQIAGVQLAEGGIVTPTPGGTSAIIGEAGRAEAVVPLPDDFDPDEGLGGVGGGVTVVFQGPLLGDENQAREFALMIDEQLLDLRRSNESQSFDEGVV